jgi:glycosyltransferase involved in cell wall biosynthesis
VIEKPIEQIIEEGVAIVIPMLNEAAIVPRLLRSLWVLSPPAAEIVAVDGGSTDDTVALVGKSGFVRVVEHPVRGRAAAINRGVAEVRSAVVCVLHADTILPDDAITVIRRTLADRRIALAGFTPLIVGPERVRWGTTFHNWIKTWYAPPHLSAAPILARRSAFVRRPCHVLSTGGFLGRWRLRRGADHHGGR